MKDKKLFKKWWFWVIVVIIALGLLGSLTQDSETNQTTSSPTNSKQNTSNTKEDTSTLPALSADDYKSKEGLVVYKNLKNIGYTVNAEFKNQALTDINGTASDLFESLDPNKPEDKESVDAFIVGDLIQDGDIVNLTIVLQSN